MSNINWSIKENTLSDGSKVYAVYAMHYDAICIDCVDEKAAHELLKTLEKCAV